MPSDVLLKFIDNAIRRGNTFWFPPESAIAIIQEAKLQGAPILGFDGAQIDGASTAPSLADSWDYSSHAYPPVADPYEHATRFIQERANRGLFFEIVLGRPVGRST